MVTRNLKRTREPAANASDIDLKDDCLLSTRQAATLVALTPKTLRQLRCDRNGPPFLKLGDGKQSRCVYRRSQLEAWIGRNARVGDGGSP